MSRVPDEELISAFLDDEVTDEERAYVERLLSEDPKSRTLCEEMRALRSSIQALPQQQLETDFSDRVLARAERAMLAPSDAATSSEPDSRAAASENVERAWTLDRLRRPLLWSGLAVAAALMVMFFSSDSQLGPEQAIVQGPRDSDAVDSLGRARNETMRAAPETSGLAEEAIMEKAGPDVDDGRRRSASTAAKVASPQGADGDAESTRRELRSGAIAGGEGAGEGKNGSDAAAFRFAEFANTEEVLIVRCDISPAAVRTKAFQNLLREQNIVWEETPGTARLFAMPAAPVNAFAADEEKPAREKVAADGLRIGLGRQELVIVEATHRQLQATLAALQSSPETFLAISVDPAPAVPGQQAWLKQYSRGSLTVAAAAPASQPAAPRSKRARDAAQSEAEESAPLSADRLDRPASGKESRDSTPSGVLRQQVAQSLLFDQQQQLQFQERKTRAPLGRLGQARARKVPFPAVAQSGAGQFADQNDLLRRRATEPEADELAKRQAGRGGEALQQAVFVLQVVEPKAAPSLKKKARSSEPAKPPS